MIFLSAVQILSVSTWILRIRQKVLRKDLLITGLGTQPFGPPVSDFSAAQEMLLAFLES